MRRPLDGALRVKVPYGLTVIPSRSVDVRDANSSKNASLPVGEKASWPLTLWGKHPLICLFSLALSVRALVAVFLTNVFSGSLVLDDQTYWGIAEDLARGTTGTWDAYESGLYSQTRVFSLPLAAVYKLTGGSQLAGQLLVAFVGASLCVVVFLVAQELLGKSPVALFPALVVALLPSQVLWSSLILKDAFVWLMLACLAYAFIRQTRAEQPLQIVTWLAMTALTLFLLAFLRPHTTVVAAWAMVLACWIGKAPFRALRTIAVVLISVLVPLLAGLGLLGVPFALNATPVSEIRDANAVGAKSAIVTPPAEITRRLTDRKAELEQELAEVEALGKKRGRSTGGGEPAEPAEVGNREKDIRLELQRLDSKLEAQVEPETIESETGSPPPTDPSRKVGLRYIGRGLSVMLLEPYPWNPSTSPSFTMAKFEAIVWYPVVILAVVGVAGVLRRWKVMLLPSLLGGGTLFLYALTEGNVGTAVRHRGEFVWVIALFAAMGLEAIQRRRTASSNAP